MAGIPTESPRVLRESLRWVPQPPYFSGGLRRGFTFGLSARRSFGREQYIPCRGERQSLTPACRSSASSCSGGPAWAGQLRRKCAGRTGPAAEQLVLFL